MVATSIFFMVIMAEKARLASAPPAAMASVRARGVICQERPQRRGVEARGGFGVLVEPEADGVLGDHGDVLSPRCRKVVMVGLASWATTT
jgi:hypothetical protein